MTVLALVWAPVTGKAQTLALKTNLLYDVALVTNIGAEISVGKMWTVSADWFFTPFWYGSKERNEYFQTYGGYITLRRYFKKERFEACPLSGHHVGIYLSGLTYDWEWGGKGYQADHFGFGGGIEYGYSARIGRQWRLDFTLGVGFQDGEYKEYIPSNDEYHHYLWLATKKRHWWGPTKAEVTLKWLIGRSRKGGKQ